MSSTPISDLIINKLSYNQYKEVVSGNTYNNDQVYQIKDISHTFNTHAGILSNCILKIPQNLKLTLENNVLTLKAGSILTNDGSSYSTKTINNDITTDFSSYSANNGNSMVFSQGGYFRTFSLSKVVSGTIDSLADVAWHVWFDTTNKEINTYGNAGTAAIRFCYPICVVSYGSDNQWHIAKDSNDHDMIFNGAGFIGHHAFVLPGVKGLISNGFDENKNLKSIYRINNALRISELLQQYNTIYLTNWSGYISVHYYAGEVNNYSDLSDSYYRYVRNENNIARIYSGAVSSFNPIVPLVHYNYDGTTVTDFTIRQPFRADESKKFTYRQW